MRFRRYIKIAPGIKLNLSKSGVSTTFGGKGFSVNTGSKGTFLNTGIPGTGLYSRNKISGNPKRYYSSNHSFSNNSLFSQSESWTKKQSSYNLFLIPLILGVVFLFIQKIIAVLFFATSIGLFIRWKFSNAGKSVSFIKKARKSVGLLMFLENAYSLYPSPYLLGDIIDQAKRSKHYDIALKYLNQEDDSDLDIVLEKAECNYTYFNYKEAATYFDILLEKFNISDKNNALSKLGISLFNIGECNRALEVLQKVSSVYDDQGLMTMYIGKCFFNLGNYESAIFTLTNYIGRKRNFNKNMFEMCYTLGQIYINQNDNKNAKQWFNKIYSQDINYKDVGIMLQKLDK